MSIPPMAVPGARKTQEPVLPLPLSPTEQSDPFTVIVDELHQRELLTPSLLLSAGYVGMPFFLRQIMLLLAPLGAILGLPLQAKEPPLGSR